MAENTTGHGRFAGKVAVVTGAGSGIGLATAAQIVREGGRVIAVDVVQQRLDEAAARIGEQYVPVALDITAPDAPGAIAEVAGPQVDVLINNAGIMDGFVPVDEIDDALWDRVLAINVTSMMRLIRQFIPGMIAAGHGAIVNLASEAALRTCAGVAYTVSKHAVVGLTKNTAAVYARDGIRCNAVAPGGVATNVGGDFRSQKVAERVGAAMGASMGAIADEIAQPDALATAICFLADDVAAKNVNGVVLPVDGGWSAV
ncbi:MAG: SDR family NAD(P)-dependent oxidoreductase [Propionibacteriaceae bacterium]|nr:SDR family NAD(P)-dependent oxidoreductase [Propionibacteriaceae bacterium]